MTLEISNNQAEAEEIGEAIFAVFKQKFYENTKRAPYDRFEDALKEVNKAIETMKEEKVSRFIGNMSSAFGAVCGSELFVSVTGDAEVYLVRKHFVSIISEGLAEDAPAGNFVNIANGTLEEADRLLFSSVRLLRYITKSELGRVFGDPTSPGIGTSLAELQDFIMAEILGRVALIGVVAREQLVESFEEEETRRRAPSFLKRWNFSMPKLPAFITDLARRDSLPKVKDMLRPAGDLGSKIMGAFSSMKMPKMPSMPHKSSGLGAMSKERLLLLTVGLLVVFVGGVFWLKNTGDAKREIAEQQAKLNHVRELINDASTQGQFDKVKASELFSTAEKETYEVLNAGVLRPQAVKMLDEINAGRDSLDEVKRVATPTVVADLSTKNASVSALGLLNLKERLFGFEYNKLYEIVLTTLQEPLPISETETVVLGTPFPEQNSLLFLTRTGKMIEYANASFAFIGTKDGLWKKGVDMKTYADRVYILDSERNQVWRYIRRRDAFDIGEGINQDADLKKAVSIAIDSNIYLLNFDGTITQLYQGKKQDYPLRKMPLSPLTSPTKIFTSPDLGFIYILEPSKKRVVVFKKDTQNGGAQYSTQYVFENTGTLRDLLVNDGRLFVMDDKKVYSVNLSGL